jgi:hypothetical protein
MELRIFDVGGPHTPLVGAYSRMGWNHPGPLPFWLLALPYRLLGARPVGMLLGAVAIHAAAAGGCLVLAKRRGGTALMALVGLLLAAMVRGYGAGYLVLPWNPDLPALATALLILATWSVLEGEITLLPVVVAVSCFAWQSHLGYLPLTGTLAVVAVVGAAVGARRRGVAARRVAWVAGTTAVAAALCLAPLALDQLTNEPGNLRMILHSLRHPDGEPAGFRRASAIAAAHLSPTGAWLTSDDPINPFSAGATGHNPILLVLPAGAVLGAAVAARRARADDALRFLGVTSLSAAVGLVAVARTTGEPYFYLFTWFRPVAMLLWASVIWALFRWAQGRPWARARARPPVVAAATVAVALATVAAAVTSLVSGPGLTLSDEATSASIQVLAPAVLAATAGQPRVDLTLAGGWCAGETGHGLAVELVEHGVEVAVDPALALPYGHHRVGLGGRPRLDLVCGPGAGEWAARSPVPPLITTGLLTADEIAEMHALQDGFRAQLEAAGRPDLVSATENRGIVVLAGQDGDHDLHIEFDSRRIARFDELLEKGRHAAVVFYQPGGAG